MALDTSSPKQRFIKSKERVESHRSLISHPQFEASIDAALSEYADNLLRKIPATSNEGAGHAFALAGAYEFVRVLKNLSELPDIPKPSRIAELNHNL